MGRKRKDSGRTMMDVVHETETEEASSMHDLPSRDMFQFRSRLDSHHIPFFSTHHKTVDPPSYSEENHDNEDRDHSHSTSRFPVHQNRTDLPSFSGAKTSTSICSRKGRGRSKPLKKWNKGPKLQLELTPDGEIDGPDRVEFKTQLGVLARNSYWFPLINTSFDKMPQHLIDDLWDEIKENTTLTDEAKRDVIKDFNAKWRQGKYEVKKKNFRPYEDDEEMLKELSQDLVPPEQWEYMVEYWKLDATKFLDEGIAPCRIDLFGMSRARNGKHPVNQHISNLIKEMRDSISRVSEGERTREVEETVWTEFMGADSRGRVRCAGQGVRLSKYRRSMSSNDAITKRV